MTFPVQKLRLLIHSTSINPKVGMIVALGTFTILCFNFIFYFIHSFVHPASFDLVPAENTALRERKYKVLDIAIPAKSSQFISKISNKL